MLFIYLILIIILLFVIYMIVLAHKDTITYETIKSDQLPVSFNKFRIFFIADIHRRSIQVDTLKKVKLPVDVVMIGGDLIEKGVSFSRMRDNIRKLKMWDKRVYFVWGNNDYETIPTRLIRILLEEDVVILENTITHIYREDSSINIVGLDYYKYNVDRPKINLEQMKNTFSILLTHTPGSFYEVDDELKSKINLVLAGHTHGGQIRLFNYGFYEKGGLTSYEHTNVFTTEGYGYTLLPFRLQTNSQCHIITLEKD